MIKREAIKKKSRSEEIKDQVAKEIFNFKKGRPNLAILIFGNEHKYFNKIKDLEKEARKCGIDTNLYICEADSSQMAAEGMLEFLNRDEATDAIYVQCPAPRDINLGQLLSFIDGEKRINQEEDCDEIDWPLLEAKIFKSVLERFLSRIS